MNYAIFAGNLGQDPRHNSINGNDGPVSVLNFSLGVTENVKGEKRTTWVDCALWGKRADALEPHLHKGSKVTVAGPVSVDSYEKDGQTVPKLKLRVGEITLQGGGSGEGAGQSNARESGSQGAQQGGDDFDSDIPF